MLILAHKHLQNKNKNQGNMQPKYQPKYQPQNKIWQKIQHGNSKPVFLVLFGEKTHQYSQFMTLYSTKTVGTRVKSRNCE